VKVDAADVIEIAELTWSLIEKANEIRKAHAKGDITTDDAKTALASAAAIGPELAAADAAADKRVHDRFHPGEAGKP
jgi:hypothetical protein